MFGLTDTQILWIAILVLVLIINYQINDIRGQLKPRLKPKAEKALLRSRTVETRQVSMYRTRLLPRGFHASPFSFICNFGGRVRRVPSQRREAAVRAMYIQTLSS